MKNYFPDGRERQAGLLERPKFKWVTYLLPLMLMLAGTINASAASIMGKNPVCSNDTANYWVSSPTPGLSYKWVITHGTPSVSFAPIINVGWDASGSGTVIAYGYNSSGSPVETLSLSITILPRPTPMITSSYRVACSELAGDDGPQPRPPAVFDTGKCHKVCSGAGVKYYAKGTAGSTFSWSAAGAKSVFPMGANNDSCLVTWDGTGTGTITLTETTLSGCKGSIKYCFEIIEKPLAHFQTRAIFTDNDNSTNHSIKICLNDFVLFKDLSTGSAASPIMTSYWSFGDGKYFSSASPTTMLHQYTVPGSYTAMLVVSNACGCTDTARITIDVKADEGLYITCPGVVCEGTRAGYKVHNFTSCTLFDWSVIGGTIMSPMPYTDSIVVLWDKVDESGFGMVMFDGTSCTGTCNGSAIIKIPVIQNKGTISGPKVICVGEPAMYRLPQWPTTKYNWNEASGTVTLDGTDQWNEIVVTASVPGTIVLRANYRNTLLGCGGVAYDTIEVKDTVSIIADGKPCEGTTMSWKLSGLTIGDWTLIKPDGTAVTLGSSSTFSHLLSLAGPYKLFVEGPFCGPDTIHFDVTIKPPAVDDLVGPDKACPGVPTKYEASVNLPGYAFGWLADVGTVSPSSGSVTWANFSGSGPWQIKVWREDALGCPSDTMRKTVLSPIVPVSISGPLFVCGSSRHDYTVDYLEGEAYDWEIWDNGYGSHYIGSVTLPTDSSTVGVTWNNPHGTSEIAHLIVHVRKCGVVMSDTIDVEVNNTPSLSISGPATICSGEVALFTATSTPTITSSDFYSWNFGDLTANETTYPTASHTYNTLGATGPVPFTVTLIIERPNGCSSTITATTNITVNPQPIITFGEFNGDPVNHCGASTWTNVIGDMAGTTAGVTYSWYKAGYGALPFTTGTIPIDETLYGTGDYILTVTDAITGCFLQGHIYITDTCATCSSATMPTVSLSGSLSSCATLSATGSWAPSGWGYNPSWKYDYEPWDVYGVSTTSTTYTGSYRTAGVKRITYNVKYLSGSDTCIVKKDINLVVPFVPGLGYSFTCLGTTHSLDIRDFTTTYASAPLRTFEVDGSFYTSTYSDATSFSLSGVGFGPGTSHSIKIILTAPGLPTCSTTLNVTMPPTVVASFTTPKYNPACINDAVVEFTNTSPVGPPTWRAHWDYGDGSNNDLWQPWKVYDILGIKNVTLTVYDRYGCSASVNHNVDIQPDNLSGYLAATGTLACAGSPITLTYSPYTIGGPMPVEYKWYEQINFLEKNTSSTRVVNEPGGYWVFGTDSYGCKDKTPVTVVDFIHAPDATIAGPTSVCEGEKYTLYYPAPALPPGATYTWWENGLAIPGSSPALSFTHSAGTYVYQLEISLTVSGVTCTSMSDPYTVVVHPSPGKPTITYSVLDCDEYKVQLSATSSSAGVFNWSSGDVGTPIIVYNGGPYRVWITDAYGCVSQEDAYIPLKPDVYKYVFPVGCYQLCVNESPFTLLGPKYPASFTRWDWLYSGSTVLGGTGNVPNYDVTAPGTYNLALDNGSCADTTDDLNISFKPCPDVCFGGLQFLSHTKTMAGVMCYDTVELAVSCPPGTTYVIYADDGTLIPGTGTGPSPSKKFRYIADPGFTGPMDFVTAIFTNPITGMTCRARIPIILGTPCPNSTAKTTDDGTIEQDNIVVNEFARLLISPNPARSTVRIDYSFTGKSNQRSIEVFDMAGRRILSEIVNDASGSAILNLEEFSSGIYQVILRQDGNVFLHSKLSVVK